MAGLTDATKFNGIAGAVGKIAPLLASVLGSPLAAVGITLLANLFHVDPQNVTALHDAIVADPEANLKIKTLEYEHFETLSKIASGDYATEVDDRKNARSREIALRDYVPTILAVGFLLNYALIQFYCVTHPSSAIDVISARFQDVLIMIMSYYFGSSHKSTTRET
jgi:hypothetical protein